MGNACGILGEGIIASYLLSLLSTIRANGQAQESGARRIDIVQNLRMSHNWGKS
jgi:hypothetical protein